ncbi:MAG: hypothetical protein Q9188_000949 [Gyalolechia gomerana]
MGGGAPYFTPEEVEYQTMHINDNRGPEITAAIIIVAVLAALSVFLRLACRRYTKCAISWDEYFILAGLVRTGTWHLTLTEERMLTLKDLRTGYVLLPGVYSGLGKHVLAVGLPNAQRYIKTQYANMFLWAFAMATIKVSILLFYRRVFPPGATSQKWRICHITLLVATVILCVISVFGSGFECTPVAFVWDLTIPGGHCIDLIALARFTSISNTITDILILSLPIPIILGLQMNRPKKNGICGLFLLAIPLTLREKSPILIANFLGATLPNSVCIASIIRFVYLQHLNRMDPTWTNIDACIWTTVEPCIGIVSACLPIMGPVLRTNLVTLTTSIFRSKKRSHQANSSGGFTGSGGTHKEKKSFGKLAGVGPGSGGRMDRQESDVDMLGSDRSGMNRQGSANTGDEEMGLVGVHHGQRGAKEGPNFGVAEVK